MPDGSQRHKKQGDNPAAKEHLAGCCHPTRQYGNHPDNRVPEVGESTIPSTASNKKAPINEAFFTKITSYDNDNLPPEDYIPGSYQFVNWLVEEVHQQPVVTLDYRP